MTDTNQKMAKETGKPRIGTNKHFPSEMSGVIGGNLLIIVLKREGVIL